MMNFTIEDFEIKAFYSYPTCVVDRLNEYEEGTNQVRGTKAIKRLFDEFLKETELILNKYHLMDNKIAIKVHDKVEHAIFFVGYKDNIWCVGSMLNTYMNSCYKLDLTTLVKTPYPTC